MVDPNDPNKILTEDNVVRSKESAVKNGNIALKGILTMV